MEGCFFQNAPLILFQFRSWIVWVIINRTSSTEHCQVAVQNTYYSRVVRKARVIAAMSLLNIMSFFHLVDDFAYLNLIL